jgi:hypothetical protein
MRDQSAIVAVIAALLYPHVSATGADPQAARMKEAARQAVALLKVSDEACEAMREAERMIERDAEREFKGRDA